MSGFFAGSNTVSVGWAATTTSSTWMPMTLTIHGIEVTFEEARFILEQQFSKEEIEKMLIAYTLTKKSLESHG